jgi:uncharacterized protein (TIGR03083 family)
LSERAIDKDSVVGALVEEWEAIGELLEGLPDSSWEAPTPLPGWVVRDVVAHIVGTEAALSGEPMPSSDRDLKQLEHVRNDIAVLNEVWVESLRSSPPSGVLSRFRDLTAQRSDALRAMSQADFDAPSWTPAGQATYGRFMEIRAFDCWMHEQDMREAVGRPGHTAGPCAELSVDEIVRALGYIVGKRASVPSGSLVRFELTGPVTRVVYVAVDGRATVIDEPGPDRPATAGLALPSDLFARLAGGRVDVQSRLAEVAITGDAELGRRVVDSLAFTI